MRAAVVETLAATFQAALHAAFPSSKELGIVVELAAVAPKVKYFAQVNTALQLPSRLRGRPDAPASAPAAAAALIAAALEADKAAPMLGSCEVVGPGSIAIFLAPAFVAARAAYVLSNGMHAALPTVVHRVLVDYSSPNIAKDMHIGHLRSTILGDTMAKILEFAGHDVQRVNHVGDWGTQFGMLIAHLKDQMAAGKDVDVSITDLTAFYKEAKVRFDEDAAFKVRAHAEVVALQAGDATNLGLWRRMIDISQKMYDEVYSRLGIDKRLLLCGESFYNDKIPDTIADLTAKGLAVVDEGALVMRVEGAEVPVFLRKKDGGVGYDSTDMAALRYRLHTLHRDWIIYVVDAGQQLHFDLVFRAGLKAGWYTPASARINHTGFGVIQGEDGKKFKTRSGDTVRLVEVLDEAKERAKRELLARRDAGSAILTADADIDHAAAVLGYGGIKSFARRQTRLSDYAFSYDRMLSPDGDTAVYLQYAHARLCSIMRKAREGGTDVPAVLAAAHAVGIKITHATEYYLLVEAARFADALREIEADLMPHHLSAFLFALGGRISDFHRDCHVLSASTPADVREARLRIVQVVLVTMQQAMRLLGLEPLERI